MTANAMIAKKSSRKWIILGIAGALGIGCLACGVWALIGSRSPEFKATQAARRLTETAAPTETTAPTRTPRPAATERATRTPAPPAATSAPTDPPSPQSRLEALTKGLVGELIDLRFEAGEAAIVYDMGAQWDESTAVAGVVMNFQRLAPQAFEIEGVELFTLEAQATFKDVYGKESLNTAMRITMTRETAGKVSWKTFDPSRLGDLITVEGEPNAVYVHPAFVKAWKASQQ